jgi:N-acetylglucosaminyldiphosphoundecaprenol N-acetyl-beta-D-mannosaminyltransferase
VGLIAARAARRGWRLFLLGAAEGVAARAAEVLQARDPALIVAGTFSGNPSPEMEAELIARITAAQPDVLYVAYGAPAQDKWIAHNRERLRVPVSLGVGGSLDFLAGVAQRAPAWVQRLGLEWLHRLIYQPWRAGRIFTATVLFPLAVIRSSVTRGPAAPRP